MTAATVTLTTRAAATTTTAADPAAGEPARALDVRGVLELPA